MPITVTFGTPEYRDGGVIVVPTTFAAAVLAPSKHIFEITRVSGSVLADVAYRLVQVSSNYELIVAMPPDRSGSFRITAVGEVLKSSDKTWDTITATAKTVTYDASVPQIVDYDVPDDYAFGEPFRVRVALNTKVTGWHLNNTITADGIFIEEGAHIGTPTPYKWGGTTPPDIHTELPKTLPSDWQKLAAPPGGHKGAWHGEEGQYFLIDWLVSKTASGIFNLTLRPENPLRGPVS